MGWLAHVLVVALLAVVVTVGLFAHSAFHILAGLTAKRACAALFLQNRTDLAADELDVRYQRMDR